MSRTVLVSLLGLCLLAVSPAFAQRDVIIGEHVQTALETPHPYPTHRTGVEAPVWVDHIRHPGAVYISVHFAEFELAPGDFVVVRSEDGRQSWTYTELGKRGLGRSKDGFYAAHIKGDTAIVELFSAAKGRIADADRDQRFGYRIDHYGRGFNDAEIEEFWDLGLGEAMNLPYPPSLQKSLCGADDSREAKCYQASESAAYDTSTAVARLVKSGLAHCTGWLVGCEGHVMTNEHCIGSQSEANQIDFEFMAEGASCATNCASSLACSGTVEASGATLVQLDSALDYALVIPDTSTGSNTDLPATYGYMQLRDTGAVLGERIYIPQHPAGWGKRIALESSHTSDTGGVAQIISLNEASCSGTLPDVGYFADTQGGSSGSPVLGHADNLVVALHHCRGSAACTGSGGDPNRGVPIEAIISDLGGNLPNCALGTGNNLPTVTITAPADGTVVDQGVNVTFAGTANDPEDGDLTSSLAWSSSIDGSIGSGGGFSTSSLTIGVHTVTASVTDSGGASRSGSITLTVKDPNSAGPQNAVYDAGLGAPVCTVAGSSCSSTSLLEGRGTVGPEQNQPNTLDSCTDGTSGSYLSDESVEGIVVTSLGGDLAEGVTVEVAVTVHAWSTGSSDTLDLYHAADATNPSWTLVGSQTPPGGGIQTLTAQVVLPAGS
ncbi:MAG: trypsin-like peptidase domain-containing protein, partial [Acidobacteriota bacterium]